MASFYYDDKPKRAEYKITGRMSLNELRSLLTHLESVSQEIWVDNLTYFYDAELNVSKLIITTYRDRPHGLHTEGQGGIMDVNK